MKNKNVLWLSLLFSIGIIMTSSCSYDLELKPTDDVSTTNELLEGQLLRSSEYRYPHVYEIIADETVIKNMELAWEMMKESASGNGRREFGFYIYYDDRLKSMNVELSAEVRLLQGAKELMLVFVWEAQQTIELFVPFFIVIQHYNFAHLT